MRWLTFAAIIAALAVVHIAIGPLLWTGDEQRYTLQALGIVVDHRFAPSPQIWHAFLAANHLADPHIPMPTYLYQTVATALAFGWILHAFGLEAARWLNFIFAVLSLTLMLGVLDREFTPRWWPNLAAIAAITFSLPFLAFARLLYPESLLALGVAAALFALRRERYRIATCFAVALPFIHVRALPLAVAIVLVTLFEARIARTRGTIIGMTLAIAAIGFAAFVAFQLVLTGSITGFAFPLYHPRLDLALERLGMQLFGVRHGLLVYAPLMLCSFAGLVIGAVRQRRFCTEALVLLVVYVGTFMWSDAGETWSGRFWVAAMPLLAIGLAAFFVEVHSRIAYVAAAALALFDVLMLSDMIVQPLWFLESRQASIPYFILSLQVPVDFSLWLPVDVEPGAIPAYAATIPVLLAWFAATIIAFVLAASKRAPLRLAGGIGACVMLLAAAVASAAQAVPATAYRVHASTSRLDVSMLRSNAAPVALRFEDKRALSWSAGRYPSEFLVTCIANGVVLASARSAARPLVQLPGCAGADEIVVSAEPSGEGTWLMRDPGTIELLRRPW